MSWLFLGIGILFEVCGTTCMKLSNGFSRIVPSVVMLLCYMASLGMLTLALKQIPMNVAYAIWAGMGTLLVVMLGLFFFHETLSLPKLASILLIILGVVGVRLSGG
ncbi:MAG TPA: multidrug efflux SMR transporter [Pseudomonadota bacterium]|jgi:small multidrug resistance pump|nr:multidrug efflux SMR transporter [Pseudomonadota bacterium]HNF98827.1 multidrug efflux SMR transporter [Pseudomonadota bacterium]HNI60112.1 multidrug efflux SMR transporter [Pseudomonadota bacterium]HNK43870.1 multidrug efflux SMR transporter [Pseudomonadota bacterium]HNN52255.1 multidrug efflux SMR transporter [Pseudomonadota bacterium]